MPWRFESCVVGVFILGRREGDSCHCIYLSATHASSTDLVIETMNCKAGTRKIE
jgi:hypothetical protein